MDDDIKEETREIILDLYDTYDSHLEKVEHGGIVGGAGTRGETDITGSVMNLAGSNKTTAIHEFAHTLANSNADKLGLTDDEDFWKEIKRIRTDYRKAVSKDPRLSISLYADGPKTKIDEFMAESFTQVMGYKYGIDNKIMEREYGKDTTYAEKVVQVIDKYFKRKPIEPKHGRGERIIRKHK